MLSEIISAILTQSVAIHCKTVEEANAFAKWADIYGYTWSQRVCFVSFPLFETYEERTHYYLNLPTYEPMTVARGADSYANQKRIQIIEYSDVIEWEVLQDEYLK